ncbi:MAG: DUF1365 domain-containing protein [Rhodobacteraceae bacterium]|nr:DUF1365 domain-containing protein [Paracoccaceae bacterium]
MPEHIRGKTFHSRRGAVDNAFRYGVDYVLVEPEAQQCAPWIFSRNRKNLIALHDADHGGPRKAGSGAPWVRRVLARNGLHELGMVRILLLAQPRVLGHVFNPVSFWLVYTADDLRVVIAEVTNTYGDRHSYLCHNPDLAPIKPTDRLTARKIFHVSPFQPISGQYEFRFRIDVERISIIIDYRSGNGGILATLHGDRVPMTTRSLLGAVLRRPIGSLRVLGLIHWQAFRLWLKGAPFHPRPPVPEKDIS